MREYFSSVAGVTYNNPDGSSRQAIIKKHCKNNMNLLLVPEPDNPHDTHAIAVFIKTRSLFWSKTLQVGYLTSDMADKIHCELEGGLITQLTATISEVTGGSKDKTNYGVNVKLHAC